MNRIWSTPERTRRFIIPDDAELAPGDFVLQTATGRERSVDAAAVVPYEVTEEEATAWAKEQLGQVFGEIRGKTLGFVERLRQRTAEMREENQRAWEEGVADAPAEVHRAAARIRDSLRDVAETLRRAAREHGAGAPPTDPPPPETPRAKDEPSS